MQIRHILVVVGAVALAVAVGWSPEKARAAADQTWPPFVLVAGLLMIGVAAHQDGLFDALGASVGRIRAHPRVLLVVLLGVVAAVTAVLNLDTSAAFLTPVLILAARAQGVDEEPFLYGALYMSNAASLLLPGSNLTNLLVLARNHVSGAVFAARMLPGWLASIAVTTVFTVVAYRHRLSGPALPARPPKVARALWWSLAAVAAAIVLMLVLRQPALAVLGVGAAVVLVGIRRRTINLRDVWRGIEPASLLGLFAIAVALGTLARVWTGPAHLMANANQLETTVLGAATAVAVNNLPAAVLLSSGPLSHPRALLLGLNIGPNLAVTGSLSALIWFRAARAVGAKPSARQVSRLGVILVPISLLAAGLALKLLSPAPL